MTALSLITAVAVVFCAYGLGLYRGRTVGAGVAVTLGAVASLRGLRRSLAERADAAMISVAKLREVASEYEEAWLSELTPRQRRSVEEKL